MNQPNTLAVTKQGSLTALQFPLTTKEGGCRWVMLDKAVFCFEPTGGFKCAFITDGNFSDNMNTGLTLEAADMSGTVEMVETSRDILNILLTILKH